MIPEIGLMIGFFIITIMLSYIAKTGKEKEHFVVTLFAGITIIVTLIIMIDLLARDIEIGKLLIGPKF